MLFLLTLNKAPSVHKPLGIIGNWDNEEQLTLGWSTVRFWFLKSCSSEKKLSVTLFEEIDWGWCLRRANCDNDSNNSRLSIICSALWVFNIKHQSIETDAHKWWSVNIAAIFGLVQVSKIKNQA